MSETPGTPHPAAAVSDLDPALFAYAETLLAGSGRSVESALDWLQNPSSADLSTDPAAVGFARDEFDGLDGAQGSGLDPDSLDAALLAGWSATDRIAPVQITSTQITSDAAAEKEQTS